MLSSFCCSLFFQYTQSRGRLTVWSFCKKRLYQTREISSQSYSQSFSELLLTLQSYDHPHKDQHKVSFLHLNLVCFLRHHNDLLRIIRKKKHRVGLFLHGVGIWWRTDTLLPYLVTQIYWFFNAECVYLIWRCGFIRCVGACSTCAGIWELALLYAAVISYSCTTITYMYPYVKTFFEILFKYL